MRRKTVLTTALTLCLASALLAQTASASTISLSVRNVYLDPSAGAFSTFDVRPSTGWVSYCDESSVRVDGLNLSGGGLTDVSVSHGSPGSGSASVEADFASAQRDVNSISANCDIKYRTVKTVTKRHTMSRYRNGRQAHKSKHGNCNFGGYQGTLIMTCGGGTATATYQLRGRGKAVSAYADIHKGLAPCPARTSKHLQRGHATVTVTLSSGSFHVVQCTVKEVGAKFRYETHVKVSQTHTISDRLVRWTGTVS